MRCVDAQRNRSFNSNVFQYTVLVYDVVFETISGVSERKSGRRVTDCERQVRKEDRTKIV